MNINNFDIPEDLYEVDLDNFKGTTLHQAIAVVQGHADIPMVGSDPRVIAVASGRHRFEALGRLDDALIKIRQHGQESMMVPDTPHEVRQAWQAHLEGLTGAKVFTRTITLGPWIVEK